MVALPNVRRAVIKVVDHRKDRRILNVNKIDTNGSNRSPVPHSQAYSMGKIIEVAGPDRSRNVLACRAVGLPEAESTREEITRVLKYVTHVVERHEVDAIPHVRKRRSWQPHLECIYEHRRPTHRITRLQVSRARRVDSKTPMRVRSAGVEPLRKRNCRATRIRRQQRPSTHRIAYVWICTEALLKTYPSVPRKYVLTLSELVIGRDRTIDAVEVRLRAKLASCHNLLHPTA